MTGLDERRSSDSLSLLPHQTLGVPELDEDPAWRLAAAYLLGFRGHTRKAYFNDIKAWYAWCEQVGVHPLEAQRHHVDRWISELTNSPSPAPASPQQRRPSLGGSRVWPACTSTPSSTPG